MDGFYFIAVILAFHCSIIVEMTFFAHAANLLMFLEQLLVDG
jgi:hypothetical protein